MVFTASAMIAASADARTNSTNNAPTQKILAINDKIARATVRLEAEFSKVETKIHRFPLGLRGIGGHNNRYIKPSVVAIGPYHHGEPHLEKMEEVKLAAANYFCQSSGRSTEEVYEMVLSLVDAARGCYDTEDPSVAGVGDDDFATMMFLDGCFLLQYMVVVETPVLLNRMVLSTGRSIEKDILLLENQIPWLVVEALMEFLPVDVGRWVTVMGVRFLPGEARAKMLWEIIHGGGSLAYKPPPHLLGLLRFTQVGSMPAHEVEVSYGGISSSLSSSAVELAQIGIRLAPSTVPWFGDMSLRKGLLFGELSLSPLFLNDVTACWLVNIVAEEAITSGSGQDESVISSYLSVLAMLMDCREEDVQQLRAKRVLYTTFSNKQALLFFKILAEHLRFGARYFVLLEDIETYKRRRSMRIAIHRRLYSSFKAMTIATLFSIFGVLVAIFQTLLDSKKK